MSNISDNILKAQNTESENYLVALKQIHECKKIGHWIWWIFPQNIPAGQDNEFRIYNEETLKAYLNHEVLMKRLIKITNLVIKCLKSGISMEDIFEANPSADVKKFRYSMSLFFLGSLIIDSNYKYTFAEALYYSKNVKNTSTYNTDKYKYKDKNIYYSIYKDEILTDIITIDINYYLAFKNSGPNDDTFYSNTNRIEKYNIYNKLIDNNINIILFFEKYLTYDYILNNNNVDFNNSDNNDYSIRISNSDMSEVVTYNGKMLNEYDTSENIDFEKAKIYELEDNNNLKLITNINKKEDLKGYNYKYYT